MQNVKRPAPFVLLSSNHGSMIINRNDYRMIDKDSGYGVGYQIMTNSCFDQEEVDLVLAILKLRRKYFGDGVVGIDCGANIGVHTIEWARLMHNWGHVFSFEAQEKVFYAMAGNVALNNCLNVTARCNAVGASVGEIKIPEPDYLIPSSFGSFELKKTSTTEFIGQSIDYNKANKVVSQITLDSLNLSRIDLIKVDVEGMEEDVFQGASNSITECKPILLAEVIKSNKSKLVKYAEDKGYKVFQIGINMLAVHSEDPVLNHIKLDGTSLSVQLS
ncbi:MAG: FkbM family methyltransferase [Cycloclasticus sp.]|nr:MAG: FkbM family methyltransferase [Cycloclasticus sp.]